MRFRGRYLRKTSHTSTITIALWALLANTMAFSQSMAPKPPDAQSSPGSPVLRVSVRLMQVNVIAEDSSGQPIRDLKKEDFTLLEQGRLQHISLFSQLDDTTSPSAVLGSADFFLQSCAEQPGGRE
jgi:hypothetical protein